MESKGFFASLFDLSFTSYVTAKLIRLLYVLTLLGVCLLAVAVLIAGFAQGGVTGTLGGIIGAVITLPLGVLLARVYCEFLMVLFVIAENTTAIRQQLASGGKPEPTSQSAGWESR